jgi:hypothetical protein
LVRQPRCPLDDAEWAPWVLHPRQPTPTAATKIHSITPASGIRTLASSSRSGRGPENAQKNPVAAGDRPMDGPGAPGGITAVGAPSPSDHSTPLSSRDKSFACSIGGTVTLRLLWQSGQSHSCRRGMPCGSYRASICGWPYVFERRPTYPVACIAPTGALHLLSGVITRGCAPPLGHHCSRTFPDSQDGPISPAPLCPAHRADT